MSPKNSVEAISLAGLLHDVGKLFERAGTFSEDLTDRVIQGTCKKEPAGHYSHYHSAYTYLFLLWLKDRFDSIRELGTDWVLSSAAHHKEDTSNESVIVRLADQYSSRERDEAEYFKKDINLRTLLEPVLERVTLEESKAPLATYYRYPLSPLSSQKDSFFPKKGEELDLICMDNAEGAFPDPSRWEHMLSKKDLRQAYRRLAESFLEDLDALAEKSGSISLGDLLITFSSLLERYTANVPSATNVRHPDITLFDHLRTTAAIAQSLYLLKIDNPNLTLMDEAEKYFLLVCGDFSGIQSFIYNLTNKGAAKGLRGRSFYVSLFSRVAADYIERRLGLTRLGTIYNSGGKFYMLIPHHLKSRLYEIRDEINQELLQRFDGDVFFGIGTAPISADMFRKGLVSEAWREASLSLEKDRSHKFSQFMTPKFFEPLLEGDPTKSCSVCGSRKIAGTEERCNTCNEMEEIGKLIKFAQAILLVKKDDSRASHGVLNLRPTTTILDTEVYFLSERKFKELEGLKLPFAECIFLNEHADKSLKDLPLPNCAISFMYIGRWDPKRQQKLSTQGDAEPWDFEDFANNSLGLDPKGDPSKEYGIARLGILRMDVDNLTLVFVKGLRFPERETIKIDGKDREGWGKVVQRDGKTIIRPMATFSRMATLSRQLNHFFSAHIPKLLEEDAFDRCQIIYAGGDDLFIIGSWDQLPNLAFTIREDFKAFCCQNPYFSVSGGITLQRGKYPIYKGAQIAGKAEDTAKDLRKEWGKRSWEHEKDSLCFLEIPILWEDFEVAEGIRDMLLNDMIKQKDKGLLSYLRATYSSNQTILNRLMRERKLTKKAAWEELQFDRWRWRTAYQLKRRYKDAVKDIEKWGKALYGDQVNGKLARLPTYIWLGLPLIWLDYLTRKKRKEG